MSQKGQIKLCDNIAKNLLIEYYDNPYFKKNKDSLKVFCQEVSSESDFVRRFLFKLTRQEVDNILVGAVINSLSPEYQEFIKYKYQKKMFSHGIPSIIHVSQSQLYNWDKLILTNIYNASRFRLTIADIFLHKKIINFLEAIAILLGGAKEIDPGHEFISDFWCKSLTMHYNNYRQLLTQLENCVLHPDQSRFNSVIAKKVVNPFSTKEELATLCDCTTGTIGRYEHQFENLVREYVCA